MTDATGLNSLLRQIGGSLGLAAFATLLPHFVQTARTGLVSHLVAGRPEVMQRVGGIQAGLVARGLDPGTATATARRVLDGMITRQAMLLAFERMFILAGIAFLFVIPHRVPAQGARQHARQARRPSLNKREKQHGKRRTTRTTRTTHPGNQRSPADRRCHAARGGRAGRRRGRRRRRAGQAQAPPVRHPGRHRRPHPGLHRRLHDDDVGAREHRRRPDRRRRGADRHPGGGRDRARPRQGEPAGQAGRPPDRDRPQRLRRARAAGRGRAGHGEGAGRRRPGAGGDRRRDLEGWPRLCEGRALRARTPASRAPARRSPPRTLRRPAPTPTSRRREIDLDRARTLRQANAVHAGAARRRADRLRLGARRQGSGRRAGRAGRGGPRAAPRAAWARRAAR